MSRIAHLTFDMSIGGAERVIYNLVTGTDRSRYQVSILCLSGPIGHFGLQLQRLGYPVMAFNRTPGFDLRLIRSLRHHLKAENIDVLHCHQYTPYVYGVLAALLTGTKVLYTEHGRFHPDRRKLKRVLANPALSLATHEITAISSATRRALVDYENFPGHRIKVIYNGVPPPDDSAHEDSHALSHLGIAPNAFVMGSVARLDPIKNQAMMIRALRRVVQIYGNTYLLLVGDGPERRNLEQLSRELHLSSNVLITGYREDAELFYRAMDLFLLTSFSEGTAMTLLEAMAAGLPCVVTAVGGNLEIIENDVSGYVVPSDDDVTLAEKICTLQSDGTLRARMGHSALARFRQLFTVDKMVREYQLLYEALSSP